jgi:FHA domain/Double zinc ribbon
MLTCPNCGAENKPTADICRMCATPLSGAQSLPPTGGLGEPTGAQAGNPGGEMTCSKCGTMNEAGWAFCQQCGNKLQQAPQPPRPAATPPPPQFVQGAPTVVESRPPVERQPQPQPPHNPQNIPLGQPTVPAQPVVQRPAPPPQPPRQSPPPPPQQAAPPPPPPPQQAAPPPPPPPQQAAPPPPPPPQQAAPPPPPAQQAPPPSGQLTEQVQSAKAAGVDTGGFPCPKCGQKNAFNSVFCAACGASLTVDRTMVMSSVVAAPKAHLSLIMEGGQSGETYQLEEETIIGRVNGDISFPHDGFMSGRHARIERKGAAFVLTDESSRNGTFIRIKGEVELQTGDMILVGKQLFRFETE